MKVRIPMILIALYWLGTAAAAEKLDFGPIPAWAISSTAPKSKAVPSSADIEFLLEDRQLHFSPGTDEIYIDNVARIQSPQGLNALGTIAIMWNPDTTGVTVNKLHILRDESTIDVLATQTFTVLRRERNLEYAVLDGILTAAIQPIGLQIGDTVELAYTLKRSDPVLAGASEWLATGLPNMPIAHARFRALWSPSSTMRWKASESVMGLKERRSHDQIEVAADFADLQPLSQPKLAPERFAQIREVEFSSFRSWTEVSQRLAPLYERAAILSDHSELRREIDLIRAASSDPVSQAEAALALVQDQVRYVYLGMNDGGLVPAEVDATWARRFGDCKAKTVLLVALLRGLGIDAQPVAVNTKRGDGLDKKLPMIGWFDHVLVRAQIAGNTYWLDGARSGDRRLLNLPDPPYHWGLPLVPKGSELMPIPRKPLEEPDSTVALSIDASAGLFLPAAIHAVLTVHGDGALALKRSLANVTAVDLDRGLREYWKKQYDFVDVTSVSQTFDERTATSRWIMDGLARMDWSQGSYSTDGLVLGYKADLERADGPDRDAPYAVAFPFYKRVTETVQLPDAGAGFTIDGTDIDTTVGGIEYRRHATLDKGVFSAEAIIRAVSAEFPQSEAMSVQPALREMEKLALRIRSPAPYANITLNKADATRAQEARLAKTPTSASGYVTRGNQFLDDGNYDRALSDFNQALTLDPKDDIALADRGLTEVWQKNLYLARKDLDAAFALNAKNAVVFRGRGLLALQEERFMDAVYALSESLEFEPDNVFAFGKRAQAYDRLGEKEKALADAAVAIHLKSTYSYMYDLRASILASDSKPDQAIAEADAEIAANPSDARAFMSAGRIYEFAGEHDRAMRALDRAVEISPGEETYLWRARFRPRSDLSGRRADVEAGLKIKPDSREALTQLAYLQYLTHEYSEELATLDRLIKTSEDTAELLIQRGIAYHKSGQVALAQKDIADGFARATGDREFNGICWRLATADVDLSTALKSCDVALANSSGKAAYVDSRGFVLMRMGRYDEAIAEYDRALAMVPPTTASLYGRGIAKRRKGDLAAGDVDIEAARAVRSNVADQFAEYGVQP